jgi:hypothetical protein
MTRTAVSSSHCGRRASPAPTSLLARRKLRLDPCLQCLHRREIRRELRDVSPTAAQLHAAEHLQTLEPFDRRCVERATSLALERDLAERVTRPLEVSSKGGGLRRERIGVERKGDGAHVASVRRFGPRVRPKLCRDALEAPTISSASISYANPWRIAAFRAPHTSFSALGSRQGGRARRPRGRLARATTGPRITPDGVAVDGMTRDRAIGAEG